MHNFDAKFQDVLGPIGYSGISASQVTRVSAWFHQIGEELVDFGSPTQAIRAIIRVYNSFIMQSTMIASYSFSPPSTRSVFGPPPTLHKEPMPTPPTLGLTYHNLITEIQNAQAKIGQQGKITPLQGTISIASLTRTINSLSRPFANINWNANLGVGVQYFFVNRLGVDVHVNAGYSYLASPLLRELQGFKSLQGFLWEAGADLIFDLFVSHGVRPWFTGIYAGAMGTGDYYFLGASGPHSGVTANYNVLFNVGLRFQISRNIFKVGIMDPLIAHYIDMKIGSNVIVLDEDHKDVDVYISFAHLF